MNQPSDRQLAWQPDIYQRYSFLARLTDILSGEAGDALTLLDVGSGPIALTEAFVSPRFHIVRGDVGQFDDPSIVQLQPGAPLPFEDAAFDVAVAIEVLEHVPPAQRPSLIRELQRVSRQATIVCCPIDTPEVVEAEHQFSTCAKAVSGRDVDFLVEHREHGLPDAAQVVSWFRDPGSVLVADNAPLDEWLAFNVLDFIYACDLGEHEAKDQFAAAINARAPLARLGAAHYRCFFCAFTAPAHAAMAARVIDAAKSPNPSDSPWLVGELVRGILGWRQEMRDRSTREGAAIHRHVGELDAMLLRFKEALAEKDAHIGKLDQHLAEVTQSLQEAHGSLAQKDARALELERHLAEATQSLQEAHGSLAQKDARALELERHLAEAAQSLQEANGSLARKEARLLELEANAETASARDDVAHTRAIALERQLETILKSSSWRLMTPLRRFTDAVRRGTRITAAGGWAGVRRWVERPTTHRHHALAAGSGLFAAAWYRERYPDVGNADPLAHYLNRGAIEARDPHPLFDARYYVSQTGPLPPDTSPLIHYVTIGVPAGRDPHPLFDSSFYLQSNPDVDAAGVNPLAHYLASGWLEGRDPHPLFDSSFYLQSNPDVDAAGVNPLVHYLVAGGFENRDPHPYFGSSFYLEGNPDVAAAGVNPLLHYVSHGGLEGRVPHPDFDAAFYLASNPDVAAAGVNPLVHYVTAGRAEGRAAFAPRTLASGRPTGYVPPHGLLPWFNPLNIEVSNSLSNEPRLNVLVPGLGMRNLSGGPNTALVLAGRLAAAGIRVRLVSTEVAPDQDAEPFWTHLRHLLGSDLPPGLELVDGHDRSTPLAIGERDVFLATAWWTAQQAKYAVRHTAHRRFIYLIQDYEPLFHAASTPQALAEETYTLDHIPVINSPWLHEFLGARRVGRFADEQFYRNALVFEPAVDRSVFYPRERADVNGRRRILFYARPTGGLRNLFELGVAALQKAVADGVLTPDEWEFVGMGEQFAPLPLGGGAVLVPAPWLDLSGYARQMRESDILLSLMVSPHPSYPPLEMAASGGLVVTTSYEAKSAGQLAGLSANIVATEPTLEAIAAGLATVRSRVPDWAARLSAARVNLPQTWSESLEAVVPALVTQLLELQGSPRLSTDASLSDARALGSVHPMFRAWPRHRYDIYRREALARRRDEYPALERPRLLSFLTPVWNTDPRQLEELAESVLDQDLPDNYEWVILDNGSDRPETMEVLQRLAQRPSVRLYRSEENLGIIAGTRFCLERATGRYATTVDHDDLLAPDCVRVLTHALVGAGYPALVYTDEDKVDGQTHRDPYFKPGWDPVLFAASCYIAHLIVFDRQQALALGAYTDLAAEGSHDWDTFMRFTLAQFVPVHVPEVLYTWRMHPLSTAGNFESKPYVFLSQRSVLQKFIGAAARPDWYRIEASLLFDGTPDWRVRRKPVDPAAISTVVIQESADAARPSLDLAISHDVTIVPPDAGMAALKKAVGRCAEARRLVHLLWAGTEIDGTEWPWEAMAQFELFPDTAVVGGRVHRDGHILSAASYFGFGRGCDSPDRGRSMSDPGYFVQMWKPHSASAVPVQHCVVEPIFFKEFLARYGHAHVPMWHLGPWLGAFARARGRRVIYSPFLSARSKEDLEGQTDVVGWAAFRAAHSAVIPETRYLSPRLGLEPSTAYQPVTQETRRAQLDAHKLADGEQVLAADRAARQALYPAVPAFTRFAVLTSVYERTPPRLLELTSESLLRQRRPFDEWVLFVDGPIPGDVERIVTRLAIDSRIKLSRVPANVGIIGGLRRCLESSSAEYVLPVDGDDLVEEDALEVLEAALARNPADFVYSDEDILSDHGALTRYSRPGFDPVLNLETSYIWHLSAFRRQRALDLGVYSDPGAEFCHDWDTASRFGADRASILHVPHVLYRWRTHAASQSNSGVQNKGSVASTRHVLRQVVARQARPDLYELQPFPLFRGAEEWYIARRHDAPPAIDVLVLKYGPALAKERVIERVAFPFRRIIRISMADGWSSALRDMSAAVDGTSSHVVVVSDRVYLSGDAWVWEAIRLFDLHDDVAVVSGRIHDDQDVVVDTGRRFGSWSEGWGDFVGLRRTDPGPFALALKPHSIDVPCEVLMVVEAQFLLKALALANEHVPARLAKLLASAVAKECRRIAYSPLLEARWDVSNQSSIQSEQPLSTGLEIVANELIDRIHGRARIDDALERSRTDRRTFRSPDR